MAQDLKLDTFTVPVLRVIGAKLDSNIPGKWNKSRVIAKLNDDNDEKLTEVIIWARGVQQQIMDWSKKYSQERDDEAKAKNIDLKLNKWQMIAKLVDPVPEIKSRRRTKNKDATKERKRLAKIRRAMRKSLNERKGTVEEEFEDDFMERKDGNRLINVELFEQEKKKKEKEEKGKKEKEKTGNRSGALLGKGKLVTTNSGTKDVFIKMTIADDENLSTGVNTEVEIYKKVVPFMLHFTPFLIPFIHHKKIRAKEIPARILGENSPLDIKDEETTLVNITMLELQQQGIPILTWLRYQKESNSSSAYMEYKKVILARLEYIPDILFQIAYTLVVFQAFGLAHNDLHTGNIFIEELKEPKVLTFQVGPDKFIKHETKVIVKIFDFDRSVKMSTPLQDESIFNPRLTKKDCPTKGDCNTYMINKDWFTFLSFLKKDLNDIRRKLESNSTERELVKEKIRTLECITSKHFEKSKVDQNPLLIPVKGHDEYGRPRRKKNEEEKNEEEKNDELFWWGRPCYYMDHKNCKLDPNILSSIQTPYEYIMEHHYKNSPKPTIQKLNYRLPWFYEHFTGSEKWFKSQTKRYRV